MDSLVNLTNIKGEKISIEKVRIMDYSVDDIRQLSAKSIVEYISCFEPNVLLSAFTSPINNVTYTINGIEYDDINQIAKYVDNLKKQDKETIYNRFLDANVLYICFLDKDFVKKISNGKSLFERIKNGLVEEISDNKNSDAIGNFMQYIRQRYDYDDASRFTYVNLVFEVLESVDVDLFFKQDAKNGKKSVMFQNSGYKNFFSYLLDIINISGIERLNLFAKKYMDGNSKLQQIIGFISKLGDGYASERSCLTLMFRIFLKMVSEIDKTNLSEENRTLYTQGLIRFINSDEFVLIPLTCYAENEEKKCVAKFLVDQIKNNKIKDVVSNLKNRENIERIWCFIQKYYENENEDDFLNLVNEFTNDLIKKDETSALISIPAIFFNKHKLDDTTKNLILKTKNVGEIIKLIEKVEYGTAKSFLNFILEPKSGVKENFENELCKTSFEQIKNSNLLNYFWENMNLPKCRDILKKLACNENKEYKNDAGNLIDSFYNYLMDEKKVGRQETDGYFIELISEEQNIIKFIHDMDFCIKNIDNEIVRKNFSDAPISCINRKLDEIEFHVKYFHVEIIDPVEKQLGKEKFIEKRGLYVYELMMRPDIFQLLPIAEYEEGYLKSNQKMIDPEIWEIFTQTLKSKIESKDLTETEIKNISEKKWFSYILVKILDSIEEVRITIENRQYDWGKDKEHKELSRLTSILSDFVSALYKVKPNKDELYNVIWDKIDYVPYEFFLQQIPNGNFSLQDIISHKSKLSKQDEDDIWEKTKSAHKVETDEQGNEKLVFGENLSKEELNIIKKKTGYEYVVTMTNGKEEVVFNTDENGKLIKKKWENGPKFFWDWMDIRKFFEQREVWKIKLQCYKQLVILYESKIVFLFDLNDLNKFMEAEDNNFLTTHIQRKLLLHLDDQFKDTHSGFFKYFKKQNKDNLTMADWLIWRLADLFPRRNNDDFCCNLINLIYKDFDKYVNKQKDSNTKYKLINKFMSQISEKYLRDNLFSTKNNTLKNIIIEANKNNDKLFFKLSMSCLNKLKYDTQNNNEQQNFLNLFNLCSGEIINHVDVNFILDNLDNNCVWENLKYLTEKCPYKNEDGNENENRKKIRLICENKNFNGLSKLKNRHRSNSVKISSEDNKKGELKEKLWKEDEPKNVINKDKNFGRICKTQEEYWLKLIEFGPKDIIGYLDWRFIYRNLDKKLIRNNLKYINWSIVLSEDNSLDKIMKFIAEKEKFYTQDMEQDLNNIFWQKFKHVKDDPVSNYNFLFLLNIHPQTMANMDISFLAENLLNENIFDMEFLKTNLFHIGGEDRIKSLCEYIETNELDPQKKKNKFRLLLNSSIFAECLVYINYDDDLASIAINKLENNVVNQLLRSCSQQKVNFIYENIAKSDFNQDKKIKMLKLILCRISDEALNYLIEQNIIAQSIVTVFYGQPGDYILSEGRKCIKKDEDMTDYIKTSLKKFKVQKKKPYKTQNQINQVNNNPHLQKNIISYYNKNNGNSNIVRINLNLNENQNLSINNFNSDDTKTNIQINASRNDNNENIATQIFTEAQQVPTTDNNANNKSNVPPNNKKTRISLGIVGLIFIIAGICLFSTAPEIAIIFLVIGGLLFIYAIGFNKFRSCLCFNKSQIENSEFKQNQESIYNRTNNLQAEQMPDTNEINNKDPFI